MSSFVVEGGYKLSGAIRPQGAKNEALQIISAVLLTKEEVKISNIPEILDVKNLILLLEGMGVKVTRHSKGVYTFKADQIELQKRHNGTSYGNIAVVQNNREIMDAGEWMDIQIGAVNNADGSVRIFFRVNDTVVFDYLDDSGPIYGCGNFGIVVQEVSTSSIHLKQKESATSASIGRKGSTLNYEDIISVEDTIADDIDAKIKITKAAEYIMKELDSREREIIVLRYGLAASRSKTQQEVADKLGISRSYVSRIEKAALDKLRKRL